MATESTDVLDFVINKGHGVKGLVENGLKAVPDEYIQPLKDRHDESKVITDDFMIPTVDVSRWDDDPNAVEMICNAARKYGFFEIINHGIPVEIIEGVQEAGRKFFEQSTEEKIVYKTNSVVKSCAVFGSTSFSPNTQKVFEWKDFLHLRYFSKEDAQQNWPPICKDESLEYNKRVMEIAKKIYDVLLKGLNMEGYDEKRGSLFMGSTALRFIYYPPCPNPEMTIGFGRHTDISSFTVLLQDEQVGGLYIKAEDGESWVYVPPRKGTLVIIIGDCMQLMSNGKYKSVEHKVVTNTMKTRLSLASFINPELNQVVAPLPEVLVGGEPAVYREVVYADYLKYYLGKTHDSGDVNNDSDGMNNDSGDVNNDSVE